ncbi:MAG: MFS transporter [Serratia proteamaculans]|jgi:predicted MFS family arabinose efflux permease|uniref:MFS transporter n=1 Tax=Serratia proteamaculans TaxID=28151 RepID=UPI000D8718DB|nr:MFS transporter [Serratia proteamaculans]SPZ52915.1 Inner membrane transport protein ydhP [Serratia quinivorans]NWA74918.1 MFS transporter [Serratia proteamaculans]CAI0874710.1 Inner membrane transport protein ydhP [Serratia proteamaculans]CAI1005544.1 Inner membrane transport protein ydhP [Serratia proteamaculans]CAI1089626.1 Inner membrane transport protein ydhP [Serratia proteamaculans]
MPLALLALTISAFAIGTTEFVIVGLIPTIAEQLGVTVPSAGLLVTIYAIGVAIGAPVLTALTGRVPRKLLLISLMVLFTLGNLLAWQSPGYESLVIARLLTGLAHGVFFSIGSTIATSLVAKEKAASAIAIMFGGLTVALVTGVPLGTFIGQHFGWRETFLAVSLIGVIATVASAILVPNNIKNQASASIKDQLKVLTHPRLLLIYAITALGYGGVFTTFTFLAPMMQELAGFSAPAVSWILLAYGIAVAIGNIWGGKLADRHGAVRALSFIFAALAVLLLVFQFTASHSIAALLTVIVMGVFAFGNVPGLQVYVVQKAEQYTPNAVDVASGLNIAAFNVGIALGSVIGGQTVATLGLAQTPWIGALIVLVALLLVGVSGRLDKKYRQQLA